MEHGIHVALASEHIGSLWGIPITNTLLMSWAVMALLIGIALLVGRKPNLVPTRMQVLLEEAITYVRDFMTEVLESEKQASRFLPIIFTIFLFIFTANAIEFTPGIGSVGFFRSAPKTEHAAPSSTPEHEGMPTESPEVPATDSPATASAHAEPVQSETEFVPLLRSMNTDLNMTLALTIVVVLVIEFAGIITLGFFKYGSKFINFSSPINFVVGLIELVSETARLVSFSFRLYGNIFAGEVLIGVITFFVPYILPSGLMAFELFVGFVQAAIFSLLTLFFIKLAITEAHAEEH